MSEANKQAVRDYVAAFNAHDIARLIELFAPDAQIWGVLGAGGLDIAIPIWRELHDSLEMKLEIADMAAEGESVAVRLVETGRFVKPFRGIPGVAPTGSTYQLNAMEWFAFRDGRIAARWGARDSAAITRQVTLNP